MPTKMRLWYEGASYHVTSRGNNKINIFNESNDFEKYLSLIYEAMEYYDECNYEVICYCLMTNHVHLMIKTGYKPLGNFIGRINASYTKYFNKKYNCCGHLFQGRYFSDIVKDNTQILETSRYIHLNPVKAKIVDKPSEYKWSSYNEITRGSSIGVDKKIETSKKFTKYTKLRKSNKLNTEKQHDIKQHIKQQDINQKHIKQQLDQEIKLEIVNPDIILNYFNEKTRQSSYRNYVERDKLIFEA